MLNAIKQMIMAKEEFVESAETIYEDASGNNLDELILLQEDADEDEDEEKEDDDLELSDDNDEEEEDDDEEKSEDEEKDIMDEPVGDEEESEEDGDENNDIMNSDIGEEEGEENVSPDGEDDIMNSPVDGDNLSVPDTDLQNELPTPVGAQTSEPIDLPTDDIMNTEIDLKSNTLKDILPVPPENAADAIGGDTDDIMNQRVDAGFGGETPIDNPVPPVSDTPTDVPDEDLGESVIDDSDLLNEAITLEGDNNEGDSTGEENPQEKESPVTTAVKDKVQEANPEGNNVNTEQPAEPEQPAEEPVEEPTDDIMDAPIDGEGEELPQDESPTNIDSEVLSKLGNLTKDIEDAKQLLLDKMTNSVQ